MMSLGTVLPVILVEGVVPIVVPKFGAICLLGCRFYSMVPGRT